MLKEREKIQEIIIYNNGEIEIFIERKFDLCAK
jgi:hypothetical protein